MRWLAGLLCLFVALPALAFFRGGGGVITGNPPSVASCTPGPGVLCPLDAGSLITTNSGTITFAKSSGWYGFDVLSNGSPLGMQAVAICTATNGVCAVNAANSAPRTFYKFKSVLQTPQWLKYYCLVDSLGTTTTSDPGGASITDRNGVVFSWSGSNIQINGANWRSGDRMIKADDGMVYFSQPGSVAHQWWWAYEPAATPIAGSQRYSGVVPPTTYSAGRLRAVGACPSGL